MRSALSCAAAVALALPLGAQTGSVSRSVSVSVTNVDVVVTDSSGKPIADLTAADFEIRQDGKVQAITNFSFVRNPLPPPPPVLEHGQTPEPAIVPLDAAPPAAARAHLIVFLDNLHLTSINRNRALNNLKEYLPTVVGPHVEVQLVTWDRSLRIRGPFINEAPLLGTMLTELGKEATLGNIPVRERNDLIREIDQAFSADPRTRPTLLDSAIISVKAWADAQAADLDSTAEAVRVALSSVAGVDGRKVLFFVTERLTPRPARDLFDYFRYGTQNAGSGGRSSPGSGTAGGPVNDLTWTQWDRIQAFTDVTSSANVAGVSIVTIDAAGLGFDDSLSPETNAGFSGRIDSGIASTDMGSAMDLLADQTGGASIRGTNDLAAGLKRLEADWTAYYSLGYESPEAKAGSPRSLKVTVHRKGAEVRTRRTVIERTPEQKVADTVLAGAHIPHTTNPLGASLHIGAPKKSGSVYLLPLEFKIPFEKITLVPKGGRARGAVLFTAVAATSDGKVSKVTTERAPLDVPESALASLAGKSFTYNATLKVRPGAQTLSTALTDEVSRLTSYVQPHVLIGEKPQAK
ncbi:MAG: VWA domain-containing protein [Thermoanaerobaculia bacterium]